MNVGFIGFGEAGFHIAKGLRGEGLGEIVAYDLHRRTPGRGETIERRALESGVRLVDSSSGLEGAEILISVVVAEAALDAARTAAAWLGERHLFADFNSVSPGTKKKTDVLVRETGATFVEGVIMSPVPRHGHRVPILLGGPDAAAFALRLQPYGMRLEVLSEGIGEAAAVKMCRSIVVKGLEALLVECVVAANRSGATDRVLASLAETFPGQDWEKLAGYMLGRAAVHGRRRAQEMEEVAKTLEELGIEPIMSTATARRQHWCADLELAGRLGSTPPDDAREIAEAIEEILSGSGRGKRGSSDRRAVS